MSGPSSPKALCMANELPDEILLRIVEYVTNPVQYKIHEFGRVQKPTFTSLMNLRGVNRLFKRNVDKVFRDVIKEIARLVPLAKKSFNNNAKRITKQIILNNTRSKHSQKLIDICEKWIPHQMALVIMTCVIEADCYEKMLKGIEVTPLQFMFLCSGRCQMHCNWHLRNNNMTCKYEYLCKRSLKWSRNTFDYVLNHYPRLKYISESYKYMLQRLSHEHLNEGKVVVTSGLCVDTCTHGGPLDYRLCENYLSYDTLTSPFHLEHHRTAMVEEMLAVRGLTIKDATEKGWTDSSIPIYKLCLKQGKHCSLQSLLKLTSVQMGACADKVRNKAHTVTLINTERRKVEIEVAVNEVKDHISELSGEGCVFVRFPLVKRNIVAMCTLEPSGPTGVSGLSAKNMLTLCQRVSLVLKAKHKASAPVPHDSSYEYVVLNQLLKAPLVGELANAYHKTIADGLIKQFDDTHLDLINKHALCFQYFTKENYRLRPVEMEGFYDFKYDDKPDYNYAIALEVVGTHRDLFPRSLCIVHGWEIKTIIECSPDLFDADEMKRNGTYAWSFEFETRRDASLFTKMNMLESLLDICLPCPEKKLWIVHNLGLLDDVGEDSA